MISPVCGWRLTGPCGNEFGNEFGDELGGEFCEMAGRRASPGVDSRGGIFRNNSATVNCTVPKRTRSLRCTKVWRTARHSPRRQTFVPLRLAQSLKYQRPSSSASNSACLLETARSTNTMSQRPLRPIWYKGMTGRHKERRQMRSCGMTQPLRPIRHGSFHKLVKQRHGESGVAVFWAVNHSFFYQAVAQRRQRIL